MGNTDRGDYGPDRVFVGKTCRDVFDLCEGRDLSAGEPVEVVRAASEHKCVCGHGLNMHAGLHPGECWINGCQCETFISADGSDTPAEATEPEGLGEAPKECAPPTFEAFDIDVHSCPCGHLYGEHDYGLPGDGGNRGMIIRSCERCSPTEGLGGRLYHLQRVAADGIWAGEAFGWWMSLDRDEIGAHAMCAIRELSGQVHERDVRVAELEACVAHALECHGDACRRAETAEARVAELEAELAHIKSPAGIRDFHAEICPVGKRERDGDLGKWATLDTAAAPKPVESFEEWVDSTRGIPGENGEICRHYDERCRRSLVFGYATRTCREQYLHETGQDGGEGKVAA